MKKGFTLAELLIVISIITTLILAGFNYYSNSLRKARNATRQTHLEQIRAALEIYRSDNPTIGYPTTASGLAALDPNYINLNQVKDPFSPTYEYGYRRNAANNTIYTLGAFLEGESTVCTIVLTCGSAPCNYCTTNL